MHSNLKITAFATLLFFSEFSTAVGLGDAELRSNFGSPLDLSIPVHHLGDLTGEDLRIALSALNDNVSGHPLDALVGSKYQINYDEATDTIRLRSDDPVMEPYLAFTLSVRWPRGFLQREYTVLLDFPAIHRKPANERVAVSTPQQTTPQFTESAAPAESKAQRLQARDPVAPARDQSALKQQSLNSSTNTAAADSFDDGKYRVVRGDSLWGLADRLSAQREGSHAQWMATVFQENPRAFIANQPDRLKEAYLLAIPERCSDTRLVLADNGSDYQLVGNATETTEQTADTVATQVPAPAEQTSTTNTASAQTPAPTSASNIETAPVYEYNGKEFVSDPQPETASNELSPYELYSLADDEQAPAVAAPAATVQPATESKASTSIAVSEQRIEELERQLKMALALIEKQSQQASAPAAPAEPIISSSPALAELTTPAYLFRSMGWLAFGMSVVMGYFMYRDRGGPRLKFVSRPRRQRKDFASMLQRNN